jgi:hypothetical protein
MSFNSAKQILKSVFTNKSEKALLNILAIILLAQKILERNLLTIFY